MATYLEMLAAAANDTLRQKVTVACLVAAEKIRVEATGTPNHVLRLAWAKLAFADPEQEMKRMVRTVIVQNQAFTLAQITSATDASVQTAVDAAVDVFAV